MKRALATVLLSLSIAGCAASGVQIKEEQLAQFDAGKTTVTDVAKVLGH